MEEQEVVRYFGRAEGRVQGVGFRFLIQQTATFLDLAGWVRNESDGSVTMEVQGPRAAIDVLLDKLKGGNGFCKVSNLTLERRDVRADASSFDIRY